MKHSRQAVNTRYSEIISLIRERDSISVQELASHFGLSSMTIRRDLRFLSEQGYISRFHGGAQHWPTAYSIRHRL